MNWFNTRLLAQIRKEFLSLLRDPRARMVLIGPPIMQLFIFSFAATLEVTNSPVIALNEDPGRWSRELLYRLEQSSFVQSLTPVYSELEFRQRLDNREALIGVHIGPDFSRRIEAGKEAILQVIGDGRRLNSSQVAINYLQSIAADLGAEIAGQDQRDPVSVRHWFNPNLSSQWFIVPGLTCTLTMIIALMVTSLSIARERELGTFDQLLVSPSTSGEIIVAKAIPALVIGLLLGSLMVTAGILVFGIEFQGSLVLLFVSALFFILSVVGIGLVISSLCGTQQQAILGAFAIAVPMTLMSGFATPVENMPQFLEWLAQAIPLKHFLVVVHGSFLKGMSASELFANTWPMAVIALFTLGMATVFVRSRLQ